MELRAKSTTKLPGRFGSVALLIFSLLASASVHAATYGGTLSWLPPTTNADGSMLTDMAGYRIYYGGQPGNYSNSIQVANAGLAAYTVEGLAAGTYYFTVAAYDLTGNESAQAAEIVVDLGAGDETAAAVVDDATQSGSGGSVTGLVEILSLLFVLLSGLRKRIFR